MTITKYRQRTLLATFALCFAFILGIGCAQAGAAVPDSTVTINDGTPISVPTTQTLKAVLAAHAGSGDNVVVNVPAGAVLYGTDSHSRLWTDFPRDLGSISFTGEGDFWPTSALSNQGSSNEYIFMHGVPATFEDITLHGSVFGGTTGRIYLGGTPNLTTAGPLASTSLTFKGTCQVTNSITGGSIDSSITAITINVGGTTSFAGLAGGNGGISDFTGDTTPVSIGSINITITGCNSPRAHVFSNGSAPYTTVGSTHLSISGGTIAYLYGGGQGGSVGDSYISISQDASITNNVFAGSSLSGKTARTHLSMTGGSVGDSIYAGGFGGSAVEEADANVTGGTITRAIHGGGYDSNVDTSTVHVENATFVKPGYGIFAGGKTSGTSTQTITVGNSAITLGSGNLANLSTKGLRNGTATKGTITVLGNVTNSLGSTITVNPGFSLIVSPQAKLTNQGGMDLQSIFENNGTYTEEGTITKTGDASIKGAGAYVLGANRSIELDEVTPTTTIKGENDDHAEPATVGTITSKGDAKLFDDTPAPITSLARPIGLKVARVNYHAVRLSWKAVPHATDYLVYRRLASEKHYKLVGTTASLNYTARGLKTGRNYYFRIKARTGAVVSPWTASVRGRAHMPAPQHFRKTVNRNCTFTLRFDRVSGANGYQVQVYSPSRHRWVTTRYLKPGKTIKMRTGVAYKNRLYKYRVRAYRTVDHNRVYGPWSITLRARR